MRQGSFNYPSQGHIYVPFFFAVDSSKMATPLGVQLQDNFRQHLLALVLLQRCCGYLRCHISDGWLWRGAQRMVN